MTKRLTRKQIQTIRMDLGWTQLWDTAKLHAIKLYQRERNEPRDLPHTQWALQDPPPKGTWVAYARSIQTRLEIPDIHYLSTRGTQRRTPDSKI